MNHEYKTFTEAYKGLITDVYENPDFVCAPRGQKIKEKLGVKFTIANPLERFPFIQERNFSMAYVIAEALWYLSGNNSTAWISYYSKFWENITDDGQTANSAYGSRIFKPNKWIAQKTFINKTYDANGFHIDDLDEITIDQTDQWTQWNWIMEELMADNDSRRAVIHIRTPYDSRYAKKDVPCTLTLQFFIRENKLHLVVSMRSSDLILGIANDIPAFTIFQELLALELSERMQRTIEVGTYTHISNSLHLYERNFSMAENIISAPNVTTNCVINVPKMPSLPPIQRLLKYENQIRNSNSPKLILSSINDLHPYWRDWLRILTSHRYGKLQDKNLQQKVLLETDWAGYHFFDK